jgi:hypothetical protein
MTSLISMDDTIKNVLFHPPQMHRRSVIPNVDFVSGIGRVSLSRWVAPLLG